MKPTFQTDRLLVFQFEIDHAPKGTFDLYLAYDRSDNEHPYCQTVECSTASDDNCVLWVETRGPKKQGFAIELLNGIASHKRFKEPLYPNYTIKNLADALFARHEQWFKDRGRK